MESGSGSGSGEEGKEEGVVVVLAAEDAEAFVLPGRDRPAWNDDSGDGVHGLVRELGSG